MTDSSQSQSLKSPDDMSFEEAMLELEGVVNGLEDGRIPLEDAILSYERGTALKKRCDVLLKKARLKVREVYENREGEAALKQSDLEDIVSS